MFLIGMFALSSSVKSHWPTRTQQVLVKKWAFLNGKYSKCTNITNSTPIMQKNLCLHSNSKCKHPLWVNLWSLNLGWSINQYQLGFSWLQCAQCMSYLLFSSAQDTEWKHIPETVEPEGWSGTRVAAQTGRCYCCCCCSSLPPSWKGERGMGGWWGEGIKRETQMSKSQKKCRILLEHMVSQGKYMKCGR